MTNTKIVYKNVRTNRDKKAQQMKFQWCKIIQSYFTKLYINTKLGQFYLDYKKKTFYCNLIMQQVLISANTVPEQPRNTYTFTLSKIIIIIRYFCLEWVSGLLCSAGGARL